MKIVLKKLRAIHRGMWHGGALRSASGLVLILAGMLCVQPARAAGESCAPNQLTITPPDLIYNAPAGGGRVGDVIGQPWAAQGGSGIMLEVGPSCKISYAYINDSAVLTGVTFVDSGITYPVYVSGAPGIGFAVGTRIYGSGTAWIPVKNFSLPGYAAYPYPGGSGIRTQMGLEVRVTYVVTGKLNAGTTNVPKHVPVQITVYGADGAGGPIAGGAMAMTAPFKVTVVPAACTVTSGGNQTVNLPKVSAGDFKGVGSHAGTKAFNIGLSCPAGLAVHATMTDATVPSNTTDVLSLSPSSTATGVGLQILANGSTSPVSFGPDSSAPGNTNQFYIGGDAGTPAKNYSIPFEVRYVQSSSAVSPGGVSALSTITFSYQ